MAEFKEYVVSMIVTREHEFVVPARTEEEAAALAQDLFDEGDDGEIVETFVESIDAVSGSAEADDEFIEE